MIRTLRRSALALTLALSSVATIAVVFPAGDVLAATPAATTYLKGKHEEVQKLLKTPATPDREKKIDAALDALVDYDQMAKDALGANWEKRSDGEKKEFTDLLRQLIQKNYKKKLQQTLDYQIDYTGEDAKGSDVVVHTEAKNVNDKRESSVQIDYVVRKKGTGYIVVDLIPEQSSMIKTYNKEFTKVITKDGFPAVIQKMKDKLAKP